MNYKYFLYLNKLYFYLIIGIFFMSFFKKWRWFHYIICVKFIMCFTRFWANLNKFIMVKMISSLMNKDKLLWIREFINQNYE
jgi:hypothetical protein